MGSDNCVCTILISEETLTYSYFILFFIEGHGKTQQNPSHISHIFTLNLKVHICGFVSNEVIYHGVSATESPA